MFPTEVEAQDFRPTDTEHITVHISGVGLCETGAYTASLIVRESPDIVILAGIGGAYPDSGLKIGDVVAIGSEIASDQGAFRGGELQPLYSKYYTCKYAARQKSLNIVDGSSVNAAAATFFDHGHRRVESMEGAAFFATARALGVEFLEVRAISNMTNSSRDEWRLDVATKSLAEALYKLIDEIKA